MYSSSRRMNATRLLEKIPGALTWSILLLPLLLAPFFPEVVALLLMLYSLFWLFQSVTYSFQLIRSFKTFRRQERLAESDTAEDKILQLSGVQKVIREYELKKPTLNTPLLESEIEHVLLVPTYKEPYEVLEDTFQTICRANVDLARVHIVLACEERDLENATIVAARLKEAFSGRFATFHITYHPKDTPGEMVGKGANITHAMQVFCKTMQAEGRLLTPEDRERFIVTSIDSDHRIHKEYLRLLELYYLHTPGRQHYSYQPLPFLYNNIWQVPIFNRIVAISSMFWHLIESGRAHRLRNFSSHAQPLGALMDMDFWSVSTIVEDGHQFWRSYIHFKGQYKVIPLFIPIYQDAVQGTTYTSTLVAQYKQLRRWAYGAEDIAFTLIAFRKHWKELPKAQTCMLFLNLMEGHIMWATAPVLLSIASWTFRWLNPIFTTSTIFYNLSLMLSTFFTISLLGIVVSIWMSFILLPKVPLEEGAWYKRIYLWFSLAFQWALLPISTMLFSAIPALDAQTRLMFGNKLHFDVTMKIRKPTEKK